MFLANPVGIRQKSLNRMPRTVPKRFVHVMHNHATLATLTTKRIAGDRASLVVLATGTGKDLACRIQQPPPSTECCSWRIGGIHGRGGKYHRVRGVTGAAFEDFGVSYRCEPHLGSSQKARPTCRRWSGLKSMTRTIF